MSFVVSNHAIKVVLIYVLIAPAIKVESDKFTNETTPNDNPNRTGSGTLSHIGGSTDTDPPDEVGYEIIHPKSGEDPSAGKYGEERETDSNTGDRRQTENISGEAVGTDPIKDVNLAKSRPPVDFYYQRESIGQVSKWFFLKACLKFYFDFIYQGTKVVNSLLIAQKKLFSLMNGKYTLV